MNREIKFRGLRTDGKGWVYGCYFFDKNELQSYIITELRNVDVFSDSIGQFTGVRDVNGTDIYEGDTVLAKTAIASEFDHPGDTYVIGFQSGTFIFTDFVTGRPVRQRSDGTNDWYSIENCEPFEIEVINIVKS